MNCCVTDLRSKEVINEKNGCRLGFISDVEVDTCSGKVVAVIIFGHAKCFGMLGRGEDIRICWENIRVIGDDTVLVCYDPPNRPRPPKRSSGFSDLFGSF